MVRRKLLARLDSVWSAVCVWFVRRAPLPPDRSVRLLSFVCTVTGLPRPRPVASPR
jgi:hypothetical protein